ncbi:Membrane protein YfcA OS=Kitasatospora aureofaciens OX=1894 GN=GCM10010502_37440 PE=4 SV=1 [Kitasatospora aureofaciens]
MTDMNDPNHGGGYGNWPQQPQQPYPHPHSHSQQPQQHAPQHPYGYPVDDEAATTLLPPVPAFDDAAATTLLPPVPAFDDAAATTLLPPVPPLDDAAATTLLPPVRVSGAMPVAPPQHLGQPPVQQRPVQPQQPSRARHAAPAPQPAAQQAAPAAPPVAGMPGTPLAGLPDAGAGFDPPTMTLKRPGAPAAPPYGSLPAQPTPLAAPVGTPPGRTGSPIIDPGLQPALITAGVAALLAGGAALGQVALALVVALLQLLTAAGWFRLNGMWPARQGILLAALAGLTADVAVLLADSSGDAAAVVGTLGGFFLLVLVLQTFRPSDPKERFYALTVLGSATVVTALCTALLLADWVPAGVGAVALATLLAAAPLPGPKQLGPVLGLVAAVLLGFLAGAPVALGALAGLGALIGRRVAAYDFPSRFVHMTAGVALPLAVAAPLIWMATDLLAG